MRMLTRIFAAVLLTTIATLGHAAGQYLDDEAVVVQANSAVEAMPINVGTTVLDAVPNQSSMPSVNAAQIGGTVNAQLDTVTTNAPMMEGGLKVFIQILSAVVLLIIISTLPSLLGKGVFFWDITDVVISSLASLLVVASFIALVVVYLDKTMSDDVRNMAKIILVVCLVTAYILNFIKAKVHNSAFLAPLIAFGRLFLPLLLLFTIVLARWHGGGRVSYQRQDYESSSEYEGRIKRQEHELSESKKQSAWWIALIALTSVWLYSKLIAQKEWKGFAGYFSKATTSPLS